MSKQHQINEHPLHNHWVFWEHLRVNSPEDYKNSMREISEVSTVEEFWRIWSYLPKPSEVLIDGRKDFRKIDAFSLFKKGIKPEWEDPHNIKASELITNQKFDYDVDILWENMVLALIGEFVEESDEICGCRVVDKNKRGSKSNEAFFRLEVWLKPGVTKDVANRLRDRLLDALADGDVSALDRIPHFNHKYRPT